MAPLAPYDGLPIGGSSGVDELLARRAVVPEDVVQESVVQESREVGYKHKGLLLDWPDGRQKADTEWLRLGESVPLELAHEFVGLGFVLGFNSGIESVLWYELENEAEGLDFRVSGESVNEALRSVKQAVLEINEDALAEDASQWSLGLGLTADLCKVDYGVLWHSHYRKVGPSRMDRKQFPDWLCEVGLVYHAPMQTTSAYNSDGTISA